MTAGFKILIISVSVSEDILVNITSRADTFKWFEKLSALGGN